MLTNSFCCFRGISPSAEQKLWRSGCLSWKALALAGGGLSAARLRNMVSQLPEMQAALDARLPGYFLSRLPVGHRLRILPEFQAKTLFLDVETDGLDPNSELTVIGVHWKGSLEHYVKGENLENFLHLASQAELLVTFNGKRFDWPVIERQFGISLPMPHIDLMHEGRAHGHTGGLKRIEQRLGVKRTTQATGDGSLAVQLWSQYEKYGDHAAMDRMLEYNGQDVRTLLLLSRRLLEMSLANYPGPLILASRPHPVL